MTRPYADTVGDAAAQAGRATGYTERAVEGAKDYAADAADKVSAAAQDAYNDPEKFIRDTQTDLTRYTRDNPLQALAFAAGIAFVVGALWKK